MHTRTYAHTLHRVLTTGVWALGHSKGLNLQLGTAQALVKLHQWLRDHKQLLHDSRLQSSVRRPRGVPPGLPGMGCESTLALWEEGVGIVRLGGVLVSA